MKFSVVAALLEACVLGVISQQETYGYDLTQKIQKAGNVSESTLYPVLRRLLGDGFLESYDLPYDGRNRRYYKITESGRAALGEYLEDWQVFKASVENLLMGEYENGQE